MPGSEPHPRPADVRAEMVDDLVDFWHTAGSADPLMLLDDRAREFLAVWEAKGYIMINEEVKG